MKGRKVALLLPALLAARLGAQAPPAAPRLDVTLDPRAATVGDPVAVVLTLQAPGQELAGEPRFPAWGKSWGDAEVLDQAEPRKTGAAVWTQKITIAAFRTGKVDLPAVAVAVPLRDRTLQAATPAGLALDVRSVLPPNEPEPKPKPPAPLRPLPIGAAFWWTLAGMSALCALLVWGLRRQAARRTAAAEEARPALPPYEELSAALDGLAAEPSMLLLHTRLSLALRRYVGRALGVPAVESTTSEVQRLLAGRRIPGPLVRQTVELLRACDLVKFARLEVGVDRGKERVETARKLAGGLDRYVRPAEPAEPPVASVSDNAPERLKAVG
jgi:hypothetical protein